MPKPIGVRDGASAIAHSFAKRYFCASFQSVPPYSSGHEGTNQPFFAKIDCHSIAISFSVNTAEDLLFASTSSEGNS